MFEKPDDGHINPLPTDPVDVERTANFEGNDGELLFQRVKNPEIKKQIVDLLLQNDLDHFEKIQTGELIGKTPMEEQELLAFRPRIREQIEKELDKNIANAESVTIISFGSSTPTAARISLNWKLPDGNKPTIKQMSMIEAHEKGHAVRPYYGDFFAKHFNQGFDQSQVMFTQEDYEEVKKNHGLDQLEQERKRSWLKEYEDNPESFFKTDEEKEKSYKPLYTFEKVKENVLRDLFSGYELAERMSQLKNYYGIDDDQPFTMDHLLYAKEHYIKDTGMDNYMKFFFEAITPQSADTFLKIINSSGI